MLLKMMKNKLSKLPIIIKLTLWYSSFIIILFSVLITVIIIFSNSLIQINNKNRLINVVDRVAKGKKIPRSFVNGVFISKIDDNDNMIEGMAPEEFKEKVKKSQNIVSHFESNGKRYYYYDRVENGNIFRGIIPESSEIKVIKSVLTNILFFIPLIIIFMVFGGYFIIKRAFIPINKMIDFSENIRKNNDLSKRIEIDKGTDEIHKLAYSLNKMFDSLEKSYEREKQFNLDVTHELKTPISVISSESQYSMKYIDSIDEAKQSFLQIYNQTNNMNKIIDQIKELVNIENIKELSKERINISILFQDIIKSFYKIIENKKILLVENIDKKIYIYANKLMIERLFVNLLTNAIKFTNSKINITLENINEEVILKVEDDGFGIEKEKQDKIFDRFYQTNESRNRNENEGIGLGLALVKEIVKIHGYRITVESSRENGSCFKVNLV